MYNTTAKKRNGRMAQKAINNNNNSKNKAKSQGYMACFEGGMGDGGEFDWRESQHHTEKAFHVPKRIVGEGGGGDGGCKEGAATHCAPFYRQGCKKALTQSKKEAKRRENECEIGSGFGRFGGRLGGDSGKRKMFINFEMGIDGERKRASESRESLRADGSLGL